MKPLTKQQIKLLKWWQAYVKTHGVHPRPIQAAEHFNLRHPTISGYLKRIVKCGYMKNGIRRGEYEILDTPEPVPDKTPDDTGKMRGWTTEASAIMPLLSKRTFDRFAELKIWAAQMAKKYVIDGKVYCFTSYGLRDKKDVKENKKIQTTITLYFRKFNMPYSVRWVELKNCFAIIPLRRKTTNAKEYAQLPDRVRSSIQKRSRKEKVK